ncbi:TonB-dependent siderophore receptor [Cupriavidus sp. 30B13]|uniref:TonB-dependent siderophore receptor n=1 Tax=Cupriavidus sp. 30B13 TaxID=3384241 RepID=UPI003B8FB04F
MPSISPPIPSPRPPARSSSVHAPRPTRLAAALGPALLAALGLGAGLGAAMPQRALAQPVQDTAEARRAYDIAPGTLDQALNRYAARAGVELAADAGLTSGKASAGLRGSFTVAEGFERLLDGQGLQAVRGTNGAWTLRPLAPPPGAGTEPQLPAVIVSARGESAEALPEPYAGGQVARGARLGLLGNADIMDVPFNIASYTAQSIEDQQAGTVGDVLVNDPAVRFTTSAGHIYENYSLRGFAVSADDLALNGMYGLSPYGHSPTEFIERVEVLKGPGALLSGMAPSGGVGGVINLVPKRAGDEPLTRLSADYISSSQFGGHLDLGRRFGDRKEFGVRINAAARDGDTELDGQSKRRLLGAVGLDYRGERLRLSLDAYANQEDIRNGSPWMASFSGPVVASPPRPGTNLLRGTYGRLENKAAVLRGEYDLADQVTAYAGVGALGFHYSGFINGTRAGSVKPSGSYTGMTYNQDGYTDSLSAEAGVRARARTGPVGHQLVLGATVLQLKSGTINKTSAGYASNIYDPATPLLAGEPGSAPRTAQTTLTSFALADTLSFAGERVLLTAGVRAQRVQTKTFSSTTGAQTADYDKSALTPALGLVVKPFGPQWSLYANYIEGLSQGDTVTDTGARNFGQVFAPYKSKQVEAGAKWDTGEIANTLSVFQVSKPSMLKDNASNTYNADGEQRNRGVEWNVFGQLARQVRVLGGVTYTQGLLTHTAGGAYDGNTAYGTPRWVGTAALEWDLPWLPGLTLTGRAVRTSWQYINSANTQRIPGWTRYDAGARYAARIQGRKVVFRASVENLLDRSYWTGTFNDGFVTQNAPRTFKLSTTIDF